MAVGSCEFVDKGLRYTISKPMSVNAIISMYVTFADDQSSIAFALLEWKNRQGETFSAEIRDAAAITAATRTLVGTYTVPEGKQGTLTSILVNYHGTVETGVGQGGIVEFVNTTDQSEWEPCELLLPNREALQT